MRQQPRTRRERPQPLAEPEQQLPLVEPPQGVQQEEAPRRRIVGKRTPEELRARDDVPMVPEAAPDAQEEDP